MEPYELASPKILYKAVINHVKDKTTFYTQIVSFDSVMSEYILDVGLLHTIDATCLSIVFNMDHAHNLLESNVLFYCKTL